MAVCLDTGTTTLDAARCLAGVQGLKVVTASLSIASAPYASDGVDMALLGTDAVGREVTYTTHEDVASISQAMAQSAGTTVLVADSGKFQKTAFVKCLDLSVLNRVVTDSGCPADVREWFEEKVGAVVYAEAESGG